MAVALLNARAPIAPSVVSLTASNAIRPIGTSWVVAVTPQRSPQRKTSNAASLPKRMALVNSSVVRLSIMQAVLLQGQSAEMDVVLLVTMVESRSAVGVCLPRRAPLKSLHECHAAWRMERCRTVNRAPDVVSIKLGSIARRRERTAAVAYWRARRTSTREAAILMLCANETVVTHMFRVRARGQKGASCASRRTVRVRRRISLSVASTLRITTCRQSTTLVRDRCRPLICARG